MGFYSNKVIPWLLDITEPGEMADLRRLILRDVIGEILEIGIGTGVNLLYYPENIKRLATVEPSDAMRRRANQRADATGRIVDWHKGNGEKLPFEEGRFDTVITVDVLCTVKDIDAVLSEAYRVLKPGGRFHFLDHGLAQNHKIRNWQIRLNELSKVIAGGCELTRNIEEHIRKSEFVIDDLENVSPFSGINVLYTHIRGVAIKPL
jgi:ubiquinone/menaquinone biosynthesis C-methylase UbiE